MTLVGTDWDGPSLWDDMPDYGRDIYRDRTRAALLAFLSPDEEMVERLAKEIWCAGFHDDDRKKALTAWAGNFSRAPIPMPSERRTCERMSRAILSALRLLAGEENG